MNSATSDLEQQWRELFVRHAKVSDALERELQRGHDISVTELEALERLGERDEGGCRLQQLVDDVHMSQSALSRLVSRLEAKGLVERKSCAQDRRGIYAHVTDAGRAVVEEARPTRQRVLAEQL